MKRIGNIYDKICSIDNLLLAHKRARKDKTLYKDVKMVDQNPIFYLTQIQTILKEKRYTISPKDYTIQVVRERNKERELMKLKYYPHRIIQRAIMLQLEDMFNKLFCYHTCASLVGRGNKRIMKLMNKYLKDKKGTAYCFKMDIKKFYASVNHTILKQLLRKKIKDNDLLRLLDITIDSFQGKKGLPIGSYLSQYLANFYLAYFDHWLKEELHLKYVIRYMDDIVIFGPKPSTLRVVYRRAKKYLSGRLALQIKSNWQIFPTATRGVDYIGYRYFGDYILLRKSTAKTLKQKSKKIQKRISQGKEINFQQRCSINSYAGRLIHCNSYRLYEKYIKPIIPTMTKYYYYIIANKNKKRAIRYKNNLLSMQGLKS